MTAPDTSTEMAEIEKVYDLIVGNLWKQGTLFGSEQCQDKELEKDEEALFKRLRSLIRPIIAERDKLRAERDLMRLQIAAEYGANAVAALSGTGSEKP